MHRSEDMDVIPQCWSNSCGRTANSNSAVVYNSHFLYKYRTVINTVRRADSDRSWVSYNNSQLLVL